jgi:Transposase DDE domain
MATAKNKKIRERDVQGVKQLQQLRPLLERLHEVGCARDRAGNRSLHMDQYCMLMLLFCFNPIVQSLRGMQQASELKKVQRKLGCSRASLGSLSEATSVFRSAGLQEIVAELVDQLGALPKDSRLDVVRERITAVDGSLLAKLPQITQAAWHSRRHPDGWRMHTHFEVLRGIPVEVEVTDGRNKGDSNEKNALRRALEADRCYVLDRGYEQFSLFNAIVAAESSYVCRIRGDHHFAAEASQELSPTAVAAGVLEDSVGQLGSPKSVRIEHPDHVVRLVRVRVEPHPKRAGRRREAASQDIVLATNLLDVPADIIAELYRSRWQIEIFFRFFKHVLGCRHLLSENSVGIEIQTYCGIIVCLLITLWTGKKPTLRTYEMVCFYMQGWADEDELAAHLEKLKPAVA